MYLDIPHAIRTDGQFRHKVTSLVTRIAQLEVKSQSDPSAWDELNSCMMQLYSSCQQNAGFLVPYFFPKYPYEKPLSLSDRPFSYAMLHMQMGGSMTIRASRQIGKALEEDEPVLTSTGWKAIKNIEEGDLVYDMNGDPTKVIGVFPQGLRETFLMKFNNGAEIKCDEEHLWLCKTNGARHYVIKSLAEIRKHKGGDSPTSDQGIRIPLAQPVKLPRQEHFIQPYVLGVLIGDGAIGPTNLKFTTADLEILESMQEQVGIIIKPVKKYGYTMSLLPGSIFTKELRRMDLRHTAESKFIPDEYLFDSVENRIELLRGLMDTDGTIYGKCQLEYYTISKKLSENVQFLVESLGGKACIKTKESYYKKDGKKVMCRICYRVQIKMQGINPFKLKRKANKFYDIKYEATRILQEIVPLGLHKTVCISVDSPTKTFITRNCLVTHNSTTFSTRQLINAHMLPTFRSIYVVPHQSFLDTYANRMKDMERAFRFYQKHTDYRQNLKFKEYPNKSQIYLIKCLTDTTEARSKTTDELLFDECQLLDTELLPDIEQCQKASRIPCTIYAGTSTTMESFLETNYQYSSKGIWVVEAPGYKSESVGSGWFNCGDENDIIKAIHPNGFLNPATKQPLKIHTGHWVHQNRKKLEAGFTGFHIPQVIIPDYVYKPEKWREIVESYTKYRHNMKKFIQEILGIPTEEGQREITLKDIMKMCDQTVSHSMMKERAKKHHYSHVISGCDWGGSDYNPASRTKVSYTVHVILGIAPDKKVDILHMQQYSGMDYRDIIGHIAHDHEEYQASAIGSDFGVGAAYNMLLRERKEISTERHMIFGYVGPNTAPISVPASGAGWFNQFSLNRTESISALYAAIKDGDIRCYDWNESQDRLLELLNMYRIPTESATGVQGFRYERHGAKADDTLHALNFAYIISQLIRGIPIVEDRALKSRIDEMFRSNSTGADMIWGWPNAGHISG